MRDKWITFHFISNYNANLKLLYIFPRNDQDEDFLYLFIFTSPTLLI